MGKIGCPGKRKTGPWIHPQFFAKPPIAFRRERATRRCGRIQPLLIPVAGEKSMFHAILCTSVAVLAVGADEKPQSQKEVIADLTRQLAEAKQEQKELAEELKTLQSALNGEQARLQKRMIELDNAKKLVVAERDKMDERFKIREAECRALARSTKETEKKIGALQSVIDDVRKDVKTVVEERDDAMKKLIQTNDQLLDSVTRYERLAKAVREKRFDDARKMVEEDAPKKDVEKNKPRK
jgi:chromosome segregation ATPase